MQNGLTDRGGGCRDMSGQKTAQKDGYGAGHGLEEVEKLDTEEEREDDGATRESTGAGGRGTTAKKDTSTARSAR